MTVLRFPKDITLRVEGELQIPGTAPVIPRNRISQESYASYPIDLASLRKHDELHTVLPGTAAGDDLALKGATFGTDSWYLSAGDLATAGPTTRYGRFMRALPPEYVAGESVRFRIAAGMIDNAADGSAQTDIEVYQHNRDEAITGSDLVTTAIQSVNSTTFADYDFELDGSGLSPGDILDCRVQLAVNDAAGAAVTAVIGAIELMCDIQG